MIKNDKTASFLISFLYKHFSSPPVVRILPIRPLLLLRLLLLRVRLRVIPPVLLVVLLRVLLPIRRLPIRRLRVPTRVHLLRRVRRVLLLLLSLRRRRRQCWRVRRVPLEPLCDVEKTRENAVAHRVAKYEALGGDCDEFKAGVVFRDLVDDFEAAGARAAQAKVVWGAARSSFGAAAVL